MDVLDLLKDRPVMMLIEGMEDETDWKDYINGTEIGG